MGFPAVSLRQITTLIVSHLPQNNLLFRHLGILIMWFESLKEEEAKSCFYPQSQLTFKVMLLKNVSVKPWYFQGFPCMVSVFIVPLTGCYGMSMSHVIAWLKVSHCKGASVWLGLIQSLRTYISISVSRHRCGKWSLNSSWHFSGSTTTVRQTRVVSPRGQAATESRPASRYRRL